MTAHHVKQPPVVEGNKVVGIISHTDIGWGLMVRYAQYAKGAQAAHPHREGQIAGASARS